MANHTNNTGRRPARHRRRQGVSVLLTIILLIMALLMGGLAGFVIARRTDPSVHALHDANERIMELENTLTLIGFNEGDDPEGWTFDAEGAGGGFEGLAPDDDNADADDLWSDDGLLSGMLADAGEPVVVAEYDGGQLLSSEVVPAYNDALTDAVFSGSGAAQAGDELLLSVMSDLIADKLAAQKAVELGLDALDDAARAQIHAQAAEMYEARLADYIADTGNADLEAAGDGEDAEAPDPRAAAEARMTEDAGITLESIEATLTREALKQRYFDEVVKDVSVTDDEVKTCYDELLASQKSSFSDYPDECEYLHNDGELVLYRPRDYRAVRDILIPFPTEQAQDELLALMNQIEMGEMDEAWHAQVDALYAPLEEKAREAQEKLAAGAEFESLMDEYGCSDAFKTEPLRSQGQYIADDTFIYSQEFVEAALILEQPGQVSSPVRSYAGVHLVQYIGDAPAGEIPMAEVEDAVRAQALSRKQAIAYDQQRDAMLEQAHPKYYPERLH